MDKLLIRGGRQLNGEINIAGAKNAALPELCATLLTQEPVLLSNIPQLQDVRTTLKLLRNLGVHSERQKARTDQVRLNASDITSRVAPYDLVKTMRAAVLVLGPLLARFGEATVSLPGGCAIGSRPVDQHIKGLQAMGAQITVNRGDIKARAKRLRGAHITTEMATVTGTENLLMAATLAEGETVLDNAAREPEIVDLARLLIRMGAKIKGHGTSRIQIEGVTHLCGVDEPNGHHIISDRIEAGTFLCAVAVAGGEVLLKHAQAEHLEAVVEKLRQAGVQIEAGTAEGEDWIRVRSTGPLQAVSFRTGEYPAVPTDMQAQLMVLNSVAAGVATVTETVFENRFMHVNELLRLGARIEIDGHRALVRGVPKLSGANVMATDLRASASLVLAGLAADGETSVERIYHLDRGYEQMEVKLRSIGADVERITG